MMIRCSGQQRFRVESAKQQEDGLWIGLVEDIPNDLSMAIPDDLELSRTGLENVIESFEKHEIPDSDIPLMQPYQLNDCGWVANRWVELLDMPLIQKQRMLELDSPLVRLELVQDILLSDSKK
jgi:Lon protease-like protein